MLSPCRAMQGDFFMDEFAQSLRSFALPSHLAGGARATLEGTKLKLHTLSGISSLRSDIPPRLRRGDANEQKKMAFK